MSAIADAMYEVSDAPPEQGSVPSAIAKAARFLVDLKSGKVAQRGDVAEAKAPGAGPTRTDSVGAASGRPGADRIAAAHAAARRALGMAPDAPAGGADGKKIEPHLTPVAAPAAGEASAQPAPTMPSAAPVAPAMVKPAMAKPAVARSAIPHAGSTRPSAQSPARRAEPEQAAAPSRPPLSVQQYLRELKFQVSGHNQKEVRQAIVEVAPGEIERVTRVVAKLRGRYLAQVLELSEAVHKPVPEGEAKQLRVMREMYEEAARGLDYLRDAIEKGDVGLNGVIM